MTAVDTAFGHVRRADFLPAQSQSRADDDAPVPIGHGQTNSQPSTVRNMLDLLDVRAGHRVLDIGAGSGWTTALLAHLVGPDGMVLGLELEPDLAAWGARNVADYAMPWASVETAQPQCLGDGDRAPWDRILVSAAAGSVPEELVGQLAADGAMVIPVNGELTHVQLESGSPRVTTHGRYRFVPLRS